MTFITASDQNQLFSVGRVEGERAQREVVSQKLKEVTMQAGRYMIMRSSFRCMTD